MLNAKNRACTAVLCLAVLFKFWLIAEMEITDDPDDPPNYIAQIIDVGPSFFGPGTGCLGKLFNGLGVPFRDGIEVFYLIALLLVVRALFDWPVRSYLSLGLFLFVYFDPAPEELFSHMMSDQVWLVEILAGLACFVLFTRGQTWARWFWLAPASISLGFSTISRTTIIPLFAVFLIWGALFVFSRWFTRRITGFDWKVLAGCAACLTFVGLFNEVTCSYNSVHYGYFGLSMPDSREYRNFYMALQSVGEPTGQKYYPIDQQRLDLVAQAGPASHWFVERMGTDSNFRKISEKTFGKYDLALAWFHFVVFFNTIPNDNLRQGFAMFKDVENEIDQARRDKHLHVRPIIPLPDCRLSIVASAFPQALWHIGALTTTVPTRYAWAWGGEEPQFANGDFTRALTRRTVTASPFREEIGRALCAFYAVTYRPMLVALALAVAIWIACQVASWRKIPADTTDQVAQSIFGMSFVTFYLWYALFDASGIAASARLAIFQNVMLPLLLVYYIREPWTLLLRFVWQAPRF